MPQEQNKNQVISNHFLNFWKKNFLSLNGYSPHFCIDSFKQNYNLYFAILSLFAPMMVLTTALLLSRGSLYFSIALLAYPVVTFVCSSQVRSEESAKKILFITQLILNAALFYGVSFSASFIFLHIFSVLLITRFPMSIKPLLGHSFFNALYFVSMTIMGFYQYGANFIEVALIATFATLLTYAYTIVNLQKRIRSSESNPTSQLKGLSKVKSTESDLDAISSINEALSKIRIKYSDRKNCQILFPSSRYKEKVNISCNQKSLNLILKNIIANSIESQKNKNLLIEVSMVESENEITLSIKDNGSGMPPLVKDNVFKPEFSFNKKNQKGNGLFLVKNEVDHWGGQILIASVPEKGTTVKIKLKKSHIQAQSGQAS